MDFPKSNKIIIINFGKLIQRYYQKKRLRNLRTNFISEWLKFFKNLKIIRNINLKSIKLIRIYIVKRIRIPKYYKIKRYLNYRLN